MRQGGRSCAPGPWRPGAFTSAYRQIFSRVAGAAAMVVIADVLAVAVPDLIGQFTVAC